MGGYSFEEDCQKIMRPRTLVLVGKTGNGKSATGNSILGMQMFQSKRSLSAVTRTSVLKTTALVDGQTLNVIDTPGLFDFTVDTEFIGKEIVSCMNKVGNGVDAFLVVISVHNRFAEDEQAAISSMLTLFGRNFYDYMIIVFTGGDELEDDDESLQDFLSNSPEALQETLGMCGNRCVLFNNKTQDPTKRSNQVQKLLSLVNKVSKNNGGKPYTNGMFTELKDCTWERDEQEVYDEEFNRIYEMVKSKVKETTLRLDQLLAEEHTAQLKAVENATTSKKKSDKEIQKACYFIGGEIDSKLKETSLKLEQLLEEEQTARLKAEENAKAAQKNSEMEIHKHVDSKLMEITLKLEQLLTEERTARPKAEENAKISQNNSDGDIQKVELNLKETTLKLQEQLAEELTARLKAEEIAKAAQKKSDMEIQKFESKLKETTSKLEQLLAEEQSGRMKNEEKFKAALKKSKEEVQKVKLTFKETTSKLKQRLAETEKNAKATQKKLNEVKRIIDVTYYCKFTLNYKRSHLQ